MNNTQLFATTLTPIPSTLRPPPQHQVVISCNLVADGVLWISPTTKAGMQHAPGNISLEVDN